MERCITEFRENLLERFLRYVQVDSTSDVKKADQGIIPSADCEWDMARLLEGELKALGASDVSVTDHCYVCARISPSPECKNAPSIGFLAHLDTVESVPGANVRPVVAKNAGGETIITSSGDTLLGGDDKAGVAAIMTLAEILLARPEISHGPVEILFSPDEETGHGMDAVPLDWFRSKQCYTVDGGLAGEFEAECFNAYKSEIVFTGVARHTGTARPDMVNAVTLAADFVSFLPKQESPETTDARLGFYAPYGISAHMEKSTVTLLIRDFDSAGMKRRLDTVEALAKSTAQKHPGSTVAITHTKQYVNMKKLLNQRPEVTELLVKAAENAGIEPRFRPIRGGTDGSRLTEMGIPTPNIFTGSENHHARDERASLEQMEQTVAVLVELAKLWGKQ